MKRGIGRIRELWNWDIGWEGWVEMIYVESRHETRPALFHTC